MGSMFFICCIMILRIIVDQYIVTHTSEDLHIPEIKKDIWSVRKIFISVIAIEDTYKKPSLEDIMVIIYSNYQYIQTNREYTFNSQNDRWSKDTARCLCLEIIPLAHILEHQLYHLFVCP